MQLSIRLADAAPAISGVLAMQATRFRAWVALCVARRTERLDLASADARLLRDIGVDRHHAAREVGKAPWVA